MERLEGSPKLTDKTNQVLRTYHEIMARAMERGEMDDPIAVRFTEYVDSKRIPMLVDAFLKWEARLPAPGSEPTEENSLIKLTWQLLADALYDYSVGCAGAIVTHHNGAGWASGRTAAASIDRVPNDGCRKACERGAIRC
jgi:hypothetical protein